MDSPIELIGLVVGLVLFLWVLATLAGIHGELRRIREILYTQEPWGINTKLANLTTIAANQANELEHKR